MPRSADKVESKFRKLFALKGSNAAVSSTSDVLTKPVVVASQVLHKAEGQAASRRQEERVQLVARENTGRW